MPEERRNPIVISLRPRHAEAILSGKKTVEVRRRRVAAAAGIRLILYATAPVKAVVGMATLEFTDVLAAADAWQAYSDRMGIERYDFDAYVGAGKACLLFLTGAEALRAPVTLEQLRRAGPFRPPQSYRYANGKDHALIEALSFDRSATGGSSDVEVRDKPMLLRPRLA